MKSEVKKAEKRPLGYPCILQSGDSIVLFSAHGEGTLLKDSGDCKAGEHREDWGMQYFDEFSGSITLSND
jgi:hypothetical protein